SSHVLCSSLHSYLQPHPLCSFHLPPPPSSLFFFNDPATTEIYTLSLHDALPILRTRWGSSQSESAKRQNGKTTCGKSGLGSSKRSEEHTSELQSLTNLVCRLLLEKKKTKKYQKEYETQIGSNRRSQWQYRQLVHD